MKSRPKSSPGGGKLVQTDIDAVVGGATGNMFTVRPGFCDLGFRGFKLLMQAAIRPTLFLSSRISIVQLWAQDIQARTSSVRLV